MRQLNLTEMANKILKVVVPRIDPPYVKIIFCLKLGFYFSVVKCN